MSQERDDVVEAVREVADQISTILEAERGLRHARHQFHLAPCVSVLKAVMAGYFRRQKKAIRDAVDQHIVSVTNQFREATNDGKSFASTLIPSSLHPLRIPIFGFENSAYEDAITGAINGAATVLAAEMERGAVAPPNMASDYLRDNSLSKLTGDIAETTKDRLRTAIADAWDAGGSYDQIVGAITTTFEDFSEKRAGLIAQTEGVDAYNEGRRQTAVSMGFDEKSWETESGDPCPTCIANEEEGWIPIDQAHSSGDDSPTAHPNCECVENYRTTSGGEESDETNSD